VTVDLFEKEIREALRAYDRYVICLDKTPSEFLAGIQRLVEKAIHTFETRAPGLRHGIALDRRVTVILSQAEGDRPMCGIYFNLSSPYSKKVSAKAKA
jgi:hypothetical protein